MAWHAGDLRHCQGFPWQKSHTTARPPALPQDRTMDFEANATYKHWGTMNMGPAGNLSEPNGNGKGGRPIELCGFANYSQAYPCHEDDPPGTPTAYGWSDLACSRKRVAICRVLREHPDSAKMHAATCCPITLPMPACWQSNRERRICTRGPQRTRCSPTPARPTRTPTTSTTSQWTRSTPRRPASARAATWSATAARLSRRRWRSTLWTW
jgi:hypothetical protein